TVLGTGAAAGVRIVVPPGALATDTTIAIEQTPAGSPPLPNGFSAAGQMFALTPHGTTFAVPVTVTLPFNAASLPAGRAPELYKSNAAGQWEPVAGASFGPDNVTAAITGFSWVQVNGLLRSEPVRTWEFGVYRGNGSAQQTLGRATQVGGVLEQIVEFGRGLGLVDIIGLTQTFPDNGTARGYIFGTPSGVTYGVYAEAPFGRNGSTDPVGGIARLQQTQNFIKLSANASLSFTLTAASLSAAESGFVRADPADQIRTELYLEVEAYTPIRMFFHTAGGATLAGSKVIFSPDVWNYRFSRTPLWKRDDFDLTTFPRGVDPRFAPCEFTRTDLELKGSRTYTIDLSSLAIGEEFTLRSTTFAKADNRRGGGAPGDCEASAASAYLRDPLQIGGTSITFNGLQPSNTPPPLPPGEVPVAPAACVPGPAPDPAAGTLQFSAVAYSVSEIASASPVVRVVRTGGNRGAVTATFTTRDGSALAGTDYTAQRVSVFFADGDDTPRGVEVPITADALVEADETVLLSLSEPGGCAALGAQTTAVLTIQSDDRPPPIGLPTGIDTTFGIAGKATLERFGGDRSGLALQGDGKLVMVGGTFTDFILARFNADGSVDRSFGVDGKVTTDMGSGLRPEEALAVAIQRDGKIVVAGYTGIDATPPARDPSETFAVARYNADGSLDSSFGSGGRVSNNVNGRAFAVAIQPDGKIVLAGEFNFESTNGSDFSDVTLARLLPDGRLDPGFGATASGQLAIDLGGSNSAQNIVLQPDGAIVVSGKPLGSSAASNHTDIARFRADGSLDAGFGIGGKLKLPGVNVGQGLLRQSDGRLVLVGTALQIVAPPTSRFLLMRLNTDGSTDASFGTAGTASTALAEHATAGGVALQADGKLVVAGTRAFTANANFIIARYNVDGSLDGDFGNAGALSVDFFGSPDIGENVLVQPDGKIVVGGQARKAVDGYGLVRINP
ncbi:MAG: hypothetical protein LH480_03740, partial [Rubrivivax sp.]|nr:hypothetical protein [Rubrivivax sp.]